MKIRDEDVVSVSFSLMYSKQVQGSPSVPAQKIELNRLDPIRREESVLGYRRTTESMIGISVVE